ncbi:glycosyltransferase family A protein [soil metagenome]
MPDFFVSVIIPTYNDWDRLSKCLSCLADQTYPSHHVEIIIANNNPANLPPPGYLTPGNCQIIGAKEKGSYAARNEGLKYARGEIIGFTDSDCFPDKNWIMNAVSFFKNNPAYSRLAGNIKLFYKDNILTSAELYEKIFAFKQEKNVRTMSSSVTGNMFAKKSVFDRIGGFKEDLLSGGDHEWSARAQQEGFQIAFCKDVVILHPARYRIKELTRKTKRVAGGKTLSRKTNKIRTLLGLIKLVRPPMRQAVITIQREGPDLNFNQKLRVYILKYYLDIVERIEAAKITFGKPATRE